MDESSLHDLNPMPLRSSVLCVDCELITQAFGGSCPVCGGSALLSLARVLGGPLGEDRAVLLDPAEAEVTRLVEDLIESAYLPLDLEGESGEESAA